MDSDFYIRSICKGFLSDLLKIKNANQGAEVNHLQEVIRDWVAKLPAEDVARVEEVLGIKAL